MKEKNYTFNIDLKFTQVMTAKNKKRAIELLKISFADDYGIDLTKNEYKLIN